ncbi:hypothetical protein KBA63_04070 [Candidatus Woesebacteria bacterium]|nr:hypothetical protein [Candidatus Woesebacteria bacterium]
MRKAYKHTLFTPVLLTLLVLGGLFLYAKNTTLRSTDPVSTMTPQPTSIDNLDDGTYSNYKYGFKFEYPKDKFVQESSLQNLASWVYDPEGVSYIQLSVQVYEGQDYLDLKTSFEGKKEHPQKNSKVLSEGEIDGYRTAITYAMTDLKAPIDGNSSYTAYWWSKDEDKVIILYFYSSNFLDSFVKGNKNLFDQIVQSFKFF